MVIPENYIKAFEEFVEKNNNQRVTLFAALKMDELVDKWSIIVSASWINAENRKEIFSVLIESLQNNLSMSELSEVARIAFYTPDEHLIELFLEKFEQGQHIKEDAQVNGNIVHEGYIIALNKTANTE